MMEEEWSGSSLIGKWQVYSGVYKPRHLNFW